MSSIWSMGVITRHTSRRFAPPFARPSSVTTRRATPLRTPARRVRLKRLCDYLHRHRPPGSGGPLFLLGLVVPPLPGQLDRVGDDRRAYDLEVRPGLVAQLIDRLQRSGVEPDVWMVEGLDAARTVSGSPTPHARAAGTAWAASSWAAAETPGL